ncbi:alpha-(1,3)-fucosyltransferase C-like [Mercenaria mercenaria]|uniref:alpha-(1,3)-fucosyltransferase C-like n=1 Tax=Mercenaria mercenaria TaxID=6596 RepID=UPI001E1DE66B|nr:alpha-(1,3)-fucosyltransferase C-like [Mercenaria mercenaria]
MLERNIAISIVKMIARRIRNRTVTFFLHLIHVCNKYSLQSTIWALVLMALVGTVMISSSLDRRSQLIMEQIQSAELQDQFKKITTTTKKPKPFNPFIIPKKPVHDILRGNGKTEPQHKRYLINWYNAPPYLKFRQDALNCGFEKCQYKNCNITFERKDRPKSDAVLFDGRWVFEKVGFVRPPGQVWVFAAHEAPVTFEDLGGWWKKPQWRYGFNWTMTYDKDNTDIYLPYGEIRKYPNYVNRDYKAIASYKTHGALMINSHCNTSSYREIYVQKLSKYVPIDILGKCGKPWNCGTHYVHDDCFNLLNTTYKFFLAFENTFCNQYFSEKVYENFNYDIILIVRGGSYREALSAFPKGTLITTDSFKTIEGLGKYLGKLSWSMNDYVEMLKRKSQYYSPGYTAVYQRAMCDLCERMNNQEKYHKIIPDIVHWAYHKNPCRNVTDLK